MYGTLRHTHMSWLQRAAGDFYVYVYIQIRVLSRTIKNRNLYTERMLCMNVCMYVVCKENFVLYEYVYGTDRHKHALFACFALIIAEWPR